MVALSTATPSRCFSTELFITSSTQMYSEPRRGISKVWQRPMQQRLGGSRLETVGVIKAGVLLQNPRAHERLGDGRRRGRFERGRGCERCQLANRNARRRLAGEIVHRLEELRFLADQRRGLARQFAEELGDFLVAPQRAQDIEAHDLSEPSRIALTGQGPATGSL